MKKHYTDFNNENEIKEFIQSEEYKIHIDAMTGEELHNKAHIAIELTRRDIELNNLKKGIVRLMREELKFHNDTDDYLLDIIHSFSKDISDNVCPICDGKAKEYCTIDSIKIKDREYRRPVHYNICMNEGDDCCDEYFIDSYQAEESENFLKKNTPWKSK